MGPSDDWVTGKLIWLEDNLSPGQAVNSGPLALLWAAQSLGLARWTWPVCPWWARLGWRWGDWFSPKNSPYMTNFPGSHYSSHCSGQTKFRCEQGRFEGDVVGGKGSDVFQVGRTSERTREKFWLHLVFNCSRYWSYLSRSWLSTYLRWYWRKWLDEV